MTTKARDDADDAKDARRDDRSDARKDTRASARAETKEGEVGPDTTHLPESLNEPPGSDVLAGAEDGENVQAEKAMVGGATEKRQRR